VSFIADHCEVRIGQSAPQDEASFSYAGIPFIRAGSLEGLLAGEGLDQLEKISEESAKKNRMKLFPAGSTLFPKSGMSAKVGRVYKLSSQAYVVSHLAAVIPNPDVDENYLYRWWEHKCPATLISNDAYPSIKKSQIEAVPFSPPPLPEQKRIAAILDQADALRRQRQRALDQLDQLGQSIFYDMFGENFDDDLPFLELGRFVLDSQIGLVRGAKSLNPKYGTPYYRMNAIGDGGNFNDQKLKRANVSAEDKAKYALKRHDLLFNTRNSEALVGKTAVLYEDRFGVYNNNILRIRFQQPLRSYFIDHYLRSRRGCSELNLRKSGTTNVFAIYQKSLFQIPIPLVEVALLKSFAKSLFQIRTQRNLIIKDLSEMDSLSASLQQRAFRGGL